MFLIDEHIECALFSWRNELLVIDEQIIKRQNRNNCMEEMMNVIEWMRVFHAYIEY